MKGDERYSYLQGTQHQRGSPERIQRRGKTSFQMDEAGNHPCPAGPGHAGRMGTQTFQVACHHPAREVAAKDRKLLYKLLVPADGFLQGHGAGRSDRH